MSGLARIGRFLLVQTVRKTTAAPLAGSRAGKCTGVLRCGRSFILSEGRAPSRPRYSVVHFVSATTERGPPNAQLLRAEPH
jgi:hypothetical protein